MSTVTVKIFLFCFVCAELCHFVNFCVCVFVQDKEPRGIIPLENLSIREVEDKKPVSIAPSTGSFCEYTQSDLDFT